MSRELLCPACQQCFVLGAHSGEVVRCPRCQVVLAPDTSIQAEAPPEPSGIQAEVPGGRPLATIPCPHCGRQIAAICLFCPHCEQPVILGRERGTWPWAYLSLTFWAELLGRLIVAVVVSYGVIFLAMAVENRLRLRGRSAFALQAFIWLVWISAAGYVFFHLEKGPQGQARRAFPWPRATSVAVVLLVLLAAFLFLGCVCTLAGSPQDRQGQAPQAVPATMPLSRRPPPPPAL